MAKRTRIVLLLTYVVSFDWLQDSARSPSSGKVPGATPGPALGLSSRLWLKVLGDVGLERDGQVRVEVGRIPKAE